MVRLLCLCAALLWAAPSDAACRLALALGMDVSGSVDAVEYRLQVEGLAKALMNAEVQDQILSAPETPIWAAAYEWAGLNAQRLLVDWTALNSPEAVAGFAEQLRGARRGGGSDSTGLGEALLYGEALFARAPTCWGYTLDISGDGKSNVGPEPQVARERLAGRNINALVIGSDLTVGRDERQMEIMDLSAYFRKLVIQGHNAFIEVAQGFEDFERAMTRKL
ncbi:MAG: DUF1194 domain-containing protein, partial [Litoreibacter sp.]|nr:DUF1194 domain-containing protein [Litoreibacter sp.]